MGNFYTNIVLKGVSLNAVKESLGRMGRKAFIAAASSDTTIVYDSEADEQNQEVIQGLASNLSRQLGCVAWSVLNHDDDILWYQLHVRGSLVDEYDSTPGYFDPKAQPSTPVGGNGATLAEAFGYPSVAEAIEKALRKSCFDEDGYAFALDRHRDIAKELDLPFHMVALGYNHIASGDTPGVAPKTFIRIGE